jgi:predicted HD phosphohydrolase
MQQVEFIEMKDGTREEYVFLQGLEHDYIRQLPERLLQGLQRLDGSLQGYKVSRLEHSLQSATRAENDGADIEMVVAALVHDIGDELAPENHSQMAASILRPYVRAEVTWVVEMHGLFQMQFYAHHYGKDATGHLAYRDHPWFESCQRFVTVYDQAAFDPSYPTQPISHFEPMLREVFTRKPFDPAVLKERVA